jgi:N-acyl-phosphatidylethanolamine-hydrolysing phospholipase D
MVVGDMGAILVEPPQKGTYSEGASLAWLEFLVKASFNGYAQDASLSHVLPKSRVHAGLKQLMATRYGALWIGHATFLLRVGGLTILTDPVFSEVASPLSFSGPRRYAPPALDIAELPAVDAIIISHNHYDHMDEPSLADLARRFPDAALLLPKGNEDIGRATGFRRTRGLESGESVSFSGLRLLALPAYHETSRGGLDAHQTHALSFSLRSTDGAALFFAGDTAYGPVFRQITKAYGPHEVALVPIGAYEPREEVAHVHASPEEALQIARELGARIAIGMHWGTFPLSDEPLLEPAQRFARAGRKSPIKAAPLRIGDSVLLDRYRSRARSTTASR